MKRLFTIKSTNRFVSISITEGVRINMMPTSLSSMNPANHETAVSFCCTKWPRPLTCPETLLDQNQRL